MLTSEVTYKLVLLHSPLHFNADTVQVRVEHDDSEGQQKDGVCRAKLTRRVRVTFTVTGRKYLQFTRRTNAHNKQNKCTNNKQNKSQIINRTSAPKINRTSALKINRTSAPKINRTSAPKINRTSAPKINRTSVPKINRTSAPKINNRVTIFVSKVDGRLLYSQKPM